MKAENRIVRYNVLLKGKGAWFIYTAKSEPSLPQLCPLKLTILIPLFSCFYRHGWLEKGERGGVMIFCMAVPCKVIFGGGVKIVLGKDCQ